MLSITTSGSRLSIKFVSGLFKAEPTLVYKGHNLTPSYSKSVSSSPSIPGNIPNSPPFIHRRLIRTTVQTKCGYRTPTPQKPPSVPRQGGALGFFEATGHCFDFPTTYHKYNTL